MMTTSAAGGIRAGYQSPPQLHSWVPDELDGRPRLPQQLEGWVPAEIDGRDIREMVDRTGAA